MIGSLSCIFLLFVLTTVLVKVDTDSWQDLFFGITLVTVVLLNIASAILQGGLFGIVGKFSSRYITAVVSGQALGGIFAALAEIVSLCLGASSTISAFVYFMVANGMLLISLVAYLVLSRAVFFRFHMLDKVQTSTIHYEPAVIQASDNPPSREISYKSILKKIWVYGFAEWMTFVVTLAMYPAVTVLVNSTGKENGNPWNDMYFVPVVGYLIFSTCDYVGRILAGLLQWPQNKGWVVAVLSVLRIAFIPLLLLCNAQPRHHLPILISQICTMFSSLCSLGCPMAI
jgi:equilibrative nucleoside transporter 1/2/3